MSLNAFKSNIIQYTTSKRFDLPKNVQIITNSNSVGGAWYESKKCDWILVLPRPTITSTYWIVRMRKFTRLTITHPL